MLNPLENYFFTQPESHQNCMLYLRSWLKKQDLAELHKSSTAFYHHNGKMFCYLNVSSKNNKLYLGFVKGYKTKHHSLKKEGRKQIKVLYLNPEEDLPLKKLEEIISEAKKLY